jgi:hypothetical protein
VTLVDTSVWVDHLRAGDPLLVDLLLEQQVLCHPFVVGELACGALRRRAEVLGLLGRLPQAEALPGEEVLTFVERHVLMGQGLGWVDVHLLASAYASGHVLWTRDKRLAAAAERLGVAS